MASKPRKTVNNKTKLKPRIAANGYRLCDPLPKGQTLIDSTNKSWILGSPIGLGGFGEIYSCNRSGDRNEYVMKVDNIDGPLFAEMNFYIRVAKEELINKWIREKGLNFLGMPKYIAHGIHDIRDDKTVKSNNNAMKGKSTGPTLEYRFLVIERFGEELEKVIKDKRLTTSKACDIACKMIDVLQYIHSFGYIHADIKAPNILKSNTKQSRTSGENYYLLDYGLAERYIDTKGKHREEKADKKRANNGTVEYRSRDAHIGLISRRSDIECLAYNLIQWLYGTLPWMKHLSDANKVQDIKEKSMNNIQGFLVDCFDRKSVPNGLKDFLTEINRTKYDSEPNYKQLKTILITKLAKNKSSHDSVDSDEEEVVRKSPKRKINSRTNLRSRVSPKKCVTYNPETDESIILSDSDEQISSPPKRSKSSVAIVTKKLEKINTRVTPTKRAPPRYSTPLLYFTSSDDISKTSIEDNDDVVHNGGPVETPYMLAIRQNMEKKKLEKNKKKRIRNNN